MQIHGGPAMVYICSTSTKYVTTLVFIAQTISFYGWRFGVAVASFLAGTKLLYVEPR